MIHVVLSFGALWARQTSDLTDITDALLMGTSVVLGGLSRAEPPVVKCVQVFPMSAGV